MRTLDMNEVQDVSGGLTPAQGEALIGACVLIASVVAAPAAAAFGGGVLVGMELAKAFS